MNAPLLPSPREGPSPFLEGTNVALVWDSTALGIYKDCPRKYQYAIIEGWRTKAESVHLKFGTIYHTALERYYKDRAAGVDHDEAVAYAVEYTLRESWGWLSDNTAKNRETLVRTVIWYLEEFKDDKATTIILANGKPAVELTFKFELDFGPTGGHTYMLSGHLDRLVEFGGQVLAMDHKTTGTTLSPHYYKQFSPDNQMSLYIFATQVAFNTPARGVIIDAAQIAVGFTRFDRGVAYRRPSEIEEWYNDLRLWLEDAERSAQAGYWRMQDKNCRLCQFQDVCSKELSLRPVILASNFTKATPWNPSAVR